MNKLVILLRRFYNPVTAIALGTRTAKGMNGILGIKRRHQLLALGQDVLLNLGGRHVARLGLVNVARRGAQNQIAPQGGLNQDSLAKDWVGTRKQCVTCQGALDTKRLQKFGVCVRDLCQFATKQVIAMHACTLLPDSCATRYSRPVAA